MTELYTIEILTHSAGGFAAKIIFDPSHPVFAGHFPGQPVVPGVVMVEIAAAVVSKITGKELVLKEASLIKFLHMIDPLVNDELSVEGSVNEIEDGSYKADMSFFSGEIIFAKFKGIKLLQV